MAASFAYLRDVRPYKTSWRIQVKVLHSWRPTTSENLECIFSDEKNVKIHAMLKKDLVNRYANKLTVGDWKFIETFQLTNAYVVTPNDSVSDSSYLSLVDFHKIMSGEQKDHMLIDVMGQIVNIGEIETVEANNKPTAKLDFEMRDQSDERLPCTLWGEFAEQVYRACAKADGIMVFYVIRFAKIKSYNGTKSVGNAYNASQVYVNPPFPEVDVFTASLPKDGLTLTIRSNPPRLALLNSINDDKCLEHLRMTISELLATYEVGKVRLHYTIYAIDTDWAWYYISCRNCNKKVTPLNVGDNTMSQKGTKPKFWCATCKSPVSSVGPKYGLYAKVLDITGETKCLLYDSVAQDIIGEPATSVLGGCLKEIEDPENIPPQIQALVGKTFVFLIAVTAENIFDGKDSYRVSKVLEKNGLLSEDAPEDSLEMVTQGTIESCDQLMLTYSQDTTDSTTPSSKRLYAPNVESSDQASTSKKLRTPLNEFETGDKEFLLKCGTLDFEEGDKKDKVMPNQEKVAKPILAMPPNEENVTKPTAVMLKEEKVTNPTAVMPNEEKVTKQVTKPT
ncbi:PREDICTED: replication protein A 70 kDa DNA-binding subunit D-like [Camelina sativa]|uniref:Replication protein A 70 kDa DNA-binding subunit D-like n=1 Tax=Camelina sativa TaxID=90675 RepID=A0ABM0XEL5_CAMSA|nr:PREDICTED: replication protein A 70 kDa DNA-binding subunit D-like [Camelina sativa]